MSNIYITFSTVKQQAGSCFSCPITNYKQ